MAEKPQPIISVCVPTHNRVSMLRDVITSYWAQESVQSELVISDDGSTDDTSAVMEMTARSDPRIVYRRNDRTIDSARTSAERYFWREVKFWLSSVMTTYYLGPAR